MGGGFFALTYFGLRAFKQNATLAGATQEHEKQEAMATMVAAEIKRKDQAIDKGTEKKIVRIRRLTKKRRGKKALTGKDANSFLTRTETWR